MSENEKEEPTTQNVEPDHMPVENENEAGGNVETPADGRAEDADDDSESVVDTDPAAQSLNSPLS